MSFHFVDFFFFDNQLLALLVFSAAAAKSLQSCPTLCDPIDSSPPGSPVPGILQARTLEWVPFPSPVYLPCSYFTPPVSSVLGLFFLFWLHKGLNFPILDYVYHVLILPLLSAPCWVFSSFSGSTRV